ncbi:MAG: efflux RND transporter periplasmic adaptor subunit [Alphaproteobacteria bacterium]
MKSLSKWLLPLLILGAAGGIFSYLKSTRAVVEAEPPKERIWVVETLPISRDSHRTVVTALGTVRSGRTAVLKAKVPGRLTAVSANFNEGAALTAGDELLQIDDFDYQTALADAQAALTQAEQRLEQLQQEQQGQRDQLSEAQQNERLSRTEVNRQRSLVQRGVSARRTLDDATRTLNSASQSVAALNSAVRSLDSQISQQSRAIERAQLAMRRAERDLADTRIAAPFDGFLTNPNAALGQQISVQDTMGQLVSASDIEIRFALSEADYSSLDGPTGALLGKQVRVRWEPGTKPIDFDAEITRQSAQIDSASGSIELYARLVEPGLQNPLRPGMFVSVEIPESTLTDAVAVPVTALADGVRLYAVTQDKDGVQRLGRSTFTPLRRRDGIAYIRTDLQDGTEIVTRTFPQIAPGLKVETRPVDAESGQ